MLASDFLYEGTTHPESVGYGTLGAEAPLPSTQELLTSIDRIGSQVAKAKRISSYVQVKTALGVGMRCTCPGFRYRGTCRHIKAVLARQEQGGEAHEQS